MFKKNRWGKLYLMLARVIRNPIWSTARAPDEVRVFLASPLEASMVGKARQASQRIGETPSALAVQLPEVL